MFRRLGLALLCLSVALLFTGCIRRMATITSEPTGAKVWINGVYRGETPVEIPYNWNWFYDFRLEKEGYETFSIRERFYAPVRHWIPFDFLTELAPVCSRESQWRHYCLTPKREL